jgi:hypothetical protein
MPFEFKIFSSAVFMTKEEEDVEEAETFALSPPPPQ